MGSGRLDAGPLCANFPAAPYQLIKEVSERGDRETERCRRWGLALTSGPHHMNEGFVLTKQQEAKQCQQQLSTSGGQPRACSPSKQKM